MQRAEQSSSRSPERSAERGRRPWECVPGRGQECNRGTRAASSSKPFRKVRARGLIMRVPAAPGGDEKQTAGRWVVSRAAGSDGGGARRVQRGELRRGLLLCSWRRGVICDEDHQLRCERDFHRKRVGAGRCSALLLHGMNPAALSRPIWSHHFGELGLLFAPKLTNLYRTPRTST